ncbi:MAG TPA: hypothetical protein VFW90_02325 [Candidatus Saccharimonadales bacterium]|nr:hypothetical protein [Candidatus Saccharimonadales bacterium]
MTKSLKISGGFAALEGLLILVIIAIIGGTGWYVWHSKNQTNKSLTETTATSQSGVKAVAKPSAIDNKDTSANEYLNIVEWGVRLKLKPQISDVYYTINGSDASLGLKSLDNLRTKDGAKCPADKNSVVMISKYEPSDYQSFLQSSGYEDTAVRIGDYDYLTTVADPPVPLCVYSSDGSKVAGVSDKVQAEITAATSIEAMPQ